MPPLTYAGLFLTALATLMFEVLLTRIISVITWYHFAFFVISLAMLGMTAGAVLVFVRPLLFETEAIPRRLTQAALAFALALPVCASVVLALPLMPVSDFMGFVALLASAVVLALPFFASGVVLTLALTRAGLPPGLAYGVDLIGAAVGCGLVIPVLAVFDAPSAALLTAAAAALAAACFARTARRSTWGSLGLALALVALAVANAHAPVLRPAWRKGVYEDYASYLYARWNSYSRVTVEKLEAPPALWAVGKRAPFSVMQPIEQRVVKIDGAAATVMARMGESPAQHGYLDWELTALVHELRPDGPAAVIGVGGGRDVLAAARAGHAPIVAIELNALIVELLTHDMSEFAGLARLPQVSLVNDEARSFLTRDPRRYSVITMSLIDTWAATGSGAYSLSENGLYTREAWSMLLHKLAPDGVLAVSRWYFEHNPGEVTRMLALAFDTLWANGAAAPRDHLVLLQCDLVATLLLRATPFSAAELDRLQLMAADKGFNLLLSPRQAPRAPQLRGVASQPSRAALASWATAQALDVSAPTDDRPYFFNMLRPGDWWLDSAAIDRLDQPFLGNLQAARSLLFSVLASLILTALALLWPLRARLADLSGLNRVELAAALAYFALIGLGFMFVEIGLLSRLNAFLGRPTLALALLLGGVIFFTGLGSLLSRCIDPSRRAHALAYPLVPALLVLVVSLCAPALLARFAGASTPVRSLVSLGAIVLPALGMGLCFPLGLRLCERLDPRLGPWVWSINGAFGVCASGLGLMSSMTWGITCTLWLGAGCYLLLPIATWRLTNEAEVP
ncbi:MAG TPA: hypothetical protein VJV78_26380 [Polyangiales bacterium]|nr:hypothetical protein [Polyangiales bacterium]